MNKTSKHNPKQVLIPNLNQPAKNFTFEEVARDYNMKPEQLLEFFRKEGIFDENNRPYPYYVEQGYFADPTSPISNRNNTPFTIFRSDRNVIPR